ncbi:uncharacterized protein LOC134530279 [Bacillus rossius redtenbacheri]|uniref:uncharacterized protein LOC134530279 n=1 Tax=Bacillus rossius redtenbacheri TaxID=93214 RepID=UPI002FDC8569
MKDNPPASSPQPIIRQRKKPHMLPPLENRRNSVDCRAEVGSPVPKWRRPSLEEQLILEETPPEGRPAIRLTRCPDPSSPPGASGPPASLGISGRYAPLEPIKRRGSNTT